MTYLERPYETLLLERPAAGVVQLTLNRPDRYNAMTVTMFDELESIARAIGDDRDVRVVILTGAGKAFCAGYDLDEAEELPSLGALGMLDRQERAARALAAVRGIPVPVIAAVNGPAAGDPSRMSAIRVSDMPPPAAGPLTAGMTGTGMPRTALSARAAFSWRSSMPRAPSDGSSSACLLYTSPSPRD